MPEKGLYGKQVNTVFIEVGPQGVAEGMAGDAVRPAEFLFMPCDPPGKVERVYGLVRVFCLVEEVSHGPAALEPVLCEQVQGVFRHCSVPVMPVFGMSDMDPHVFPLDILISEAAKFADTESGGVHDGAHGLLLDAGHGGDEFKGLLLGRYIGKEGVELPHGKLCRVPAPVEDIH